MSDHDPVGTLGVRRVALLVLACVALGGAWNEAAARRDPAARASVDTTRAGQATGERSGSRRVRISADLHTAEGPLQVEISDDPDTDRKVVGFGPHLEIDSDEGVVRMFSDVVIDSSESIRDGVVALFGSVTVRGDVDGDVVAVLGSVRLDPGAVIGGDVVAVGGRLDQAPGSVIRGESVSLSFLPVVPGIPPLRALFLLLLVLWMMAMIMGGLLGLLAPTRLARAAETISERTGWSLLIGILLPPLGVMAAVLLMITLIGIPIAFLLPMVYCGVLWIGAVIATYLLGCRLMGRSPSGASPLPPILLGSLIVAALFGIGAAFAGPAGDARPLALFFPLLGLLLATALSVIGSGALVVSMFGARSGARAPEASPPAAASPQPVTPATP